MSGQPKQPLPEQFKRIAIIRLSAMGDCILLQPTVLRLLNHCPEVEIDWYIDAAWVSLFPKIHRLNMIALQKPKTIRDYLVLRKMYFWKKYDVLLAMQASFRSNILYSFVRAPLKVGFDRARARDGQWLWSNQQITAGKDHLLDGFARFADKLSIPPELVRWQLAGALKEDLPPVIRVALYAGRPVIGFLPAASKLERTPWPKFWIELLESLVQIDELGSPLVLLLGGPSQLECQLAAEIMAQAPAGIEIFNFVGQTSLYLLSGILRELKCLISPDSGPAHLASAHDTPVIGLYAVAPSVLSGPYNSLDITVDVYPEAVKTILKKDPDKVRWGTRVHNRAAMNLIDPHYVATQVQAVFSRKASRD